jgi:hypothetical protein
MGILRPLADYLKGLYLLKPICKESALKVFTFPAVDGTQQVMIGTPCSLTDVSTEYSGKLLPLTRI